MSGPTVWLEPEELLLDTLDLRARLLAEVLAEYGVPVEHDAARAAHRGVPVMVALETLAPGMTLDVTARQLVARACTDRLANATSWVIPSLHADAGESLAAVASVRRVHALTRADGATMHRWLEALGLAPWVQRITSLDGLPVDGVLDWWTRAARDGVALLPRSTVSRIAPLEAIIADTLDPQVAQLVLSRRAED